MAQALVSPGERVRTLWRRLSGLPGGKWLFSRMIGYTAPYTDTMRASVVELEPGYARVRLRDRRRVRNHLNSVHAVALANLGELTSGLAVSSLLPANARGIPVQLTVRYIKKARGTLIAECRCTLPDVSVDAEHVFTAIITDDIGDEVARATATWKLGPVKIRLKA